MKCAHIILWLLNLIAVQILAQLPKYHAQVFGAEYVFNEGLIVDIFQDKDEYIWAITRDALLKFDGQTVQKYFIEGPITHATCDLDGSIWAIGRANLVYKMTQHKDSFELVPYDTTGGLRIRGIIQMEKGPVYFISTKGLYYWNDSSKAITKHYFQLPNAGPRNENQRNDTSGGSYYYLTDGGVCNYNFYSNTSRIISMTGEFARLFAVNSDIAIITGYLEDSYWLDFTSLEKRLINAKEYHLSSESKNIRIVGFTQLDKNKFLAGSKFGLLEYDLISDRFTYQRIMSNGIPLANDKNLYTLTVDNNGIIWAQDLLSLIAIRSLDNSIGLLRNFHFNQKEEWDNRVAGITEDNHGNIWFGGKSGIKKLNIKSGDIKIYNNKENSKLEPYFHLIQHINFDGKNLILCTYSDGVWLLDPLTEIYKRPAFVNDSVRQKMDHDILDHIGLMNNGDLLISGRFYLYKIQSRTYRTSIIHYKGDKSNHNTTFQDSKNRIWIGTADGVYLMNEQYELLEKISMPPASMVQCLYPYREDEILVGTSKSLFIIQACLDGGYNINKVYFPDSKYLGIATITEDKLKRYWIGSTNGLYVLDSNLNQIQKLDYSDNIQSHLFSPSSSFKASNGLLFLGGHNGINFFIPEKIKTKENTLHVRLHNYSINENQGIPITTNTIKLKYWENTLQFYITAPFYNNASKLQFKYSLASDPILWIPLGTSNIVRLFRLAPGDYQLRVAASSNGINWYEAEDVFSINILPPFWQTWWFRILTLLGLSSIVLIFIRAREKRIQNQQKHKIELEQLRNKSLQYELEVEQVVSQFNKSIVQKQTIQEVYNSITEQCISKFAWTNCHIYQFENGQTVHVNNTFIDDSQKANLSIDKESEIINQLIERVAKTGAAEISTIEYNNSKYGSAICVPINQGNTLYAVIYSHSPNENYFTSFQLQLLIALASICSNKIALIKTEHARNEVRRQLEEKEKSILEVEKRSAQLQLIAITNHLNPHFLFNSLTSLNSLIFENQELASEFLQHLSKVYRYLLLNKDQNTVSLRQEIEFVDSYIQLQKIRFQNDIQFNFQIDYEAYSREIVPVTLQILIENCIKHNIISNKNILTITINTSGNKLFITNNNQKKKLVENSNRQGLESLKLLYQYLSEEPIEITQSDSQFTVSIPLL